MKDLRCSNCMKKLAELEDNYFDVVKEKIIHQDKGKLFIKCPKCKEITEFQYPSHHLQCWGVVKLHNPFPPLRLKEAHSLTSLSLRP